jgi:hypothetical protein
MENHYPTMDAATMFSGFGINSPGRFCTSCGYRIENPIHNMKEEEIKDES